MCGRFSITVSGELLEKRFNAKLDEPIKPRYNAAPSQKLPVITNEKPDTIQLYLWGLRPVWLKETTKKDGLTNVREETLKEKPTFKGDLRKRRCLVLTDGFYEWRKNSTGKKTPFRIERKDKKPFAFAGLWEENEKNGKKIHTFAIITTQPNQIMRPIHNRMPVILPEKEEEIWLNNGLDEKKTLSLLNPYNNENLFAYEISTIINSARIDRPEILKPV